MRPSPGKRFSLRFDKKDGVIEQYRYKGVTLLERGPAPDFWRAPTNNDRGAWKVFNASGRSPTRLTTSHCGRMRGLAGT